MSCRQFQLFVVKKKKKIKHKDELIVKRNRATGPSCRNPILAQTPHIPRSTRVYIVFRAAENLGHEPVKREVTRSSPLHLPPRRDSKIKAFTRKGTSLYIRPEKP